MDLQELVDQLAACDEEGIITVITSVMQARPETAPAIIQFAVPDLTYPPQRALAERRSNGTVKSYNEHKGFGFIACEELSSIFGNDVFLHAGQVPPEGLTTGQAVNFAVCLNKDNKPQAYDLQLGKGAGGAGSKGQGKAEASWGKSNGSGGKSDSWGAGKGGGKENGGKGWQSYMEEAMMSLLQKGGFGKGGKKGSLKGGDKGGDKGVGKSGGRPTGFTEDGESFGEYSGTIKSFNPNTGYGFIECPELKQQYGNDVFLTADALGELSQGDEVTFEAFENRSGKPQAKNVKGTGGGGSWGAPAKKRKTGGDWGAW